MLNTIVIAQGAPEGSFLVQILPFVLIFGVFWLLVIRPQQKQVQKHQAILNSLKKDDKVITSSGILGTIEKVDGQVIDLRIARDTKIKVLLSNVKGLQDQLLIAGDAEIEDKSSSDKKNSKTKSDDSDKAADDSSDDSGKW
ncbi:preprotein translocase subunit YajC [Bradymonas sediminis]|uniref:Preprotein translocase subunit YajC n=1 Tax=Bradymonas sediminis TaxID=1548548 RepID=A0A2Z4FQY7_9DELT|nr:preprotein translocase subunit YajC [Bradymonas sediminis]AWV91397.1 preprotein translocase subunit YajC [Bradymonas sediminis]TDP76720.1 preprotein translocase YajC subunit [Bradymonas sediminis]